MINNGNDCFNLRIHKLMRKGTAKCKRNKCQRIRKENPNRTYTCLTCACAHAIVYSINEIVDNRLKVYCLKQPTHTHIHIYQLLGATKMRCDDKINDDDDDDGGE